MSMIKATYKLESEDTKNKTIEQLYAVIAREMGFDAEDKGVFFNCTKVNISKNIQDNIYEAYRIQHPDVFQQQPAAAEQQVTILLAQSGPKVSKELPDDTVEVFDGFICDADGNALKYGTSLGENP